MSDRMRVVVAGGGIAGVEALLALHDLAGDRLETTLVSPGPAFRFRPFAVAEPFGLGRVEEVPYAQLCAAAGADWVDAELAAVDAARGQVQLADGRVLAYDALIVAAGAQAQPGPAGTTTFQPDRARDILSGLLRDLEEGYSKSVAFVVGEGAVWPLPAYELALMTARQVRGMGSGASVTVVTPEPEPLAAFGPDAVQTLTRTLEEAGVTLFAGSTASVERAPDVHLRLDPSGKIVAADRIVTLPELRGRPISGVPADADGFILTDDRCRVQGLEHVYAAGDGVHSPVKLGGLATSQARTAARDIARRAGATVADPGDEVVLDGVLMTGAAPVALSGESAVSEAAPIWWPARKVASRYLERLLAGEDPPAPEGSGTRLRLSSADLLHLGQRMREYRR